MAPAQAGTWQPFIWDRTCARPLATHPDDRPGNGLGRLRGPRHPYSVLLPVGFTVPALSPWPRWALTPPFHPYLPMEGGLLSVALSLGSPPPDVIRHRVSVEPGLSSPCGLSTPARRGCPANWPALTSPYERETPAETNGAAGLSRYRSGPGRNSASRPGSCAWRHGRHCI